MALPLCAGLSASVPVKAAVGDSVSVESLPEAAPKPKPKRKPLKKPAKATLPNPTPPAPDSATTDIPPTTTAPTSTTPAIPAEHDAIVAVAAPVVASAAPTAPIELPVQTTKPLAAEAATRAGEANADAGVTLHLGARYRLGILPQPVINLFARGGGTYLFHFVGAELDARWKRFSLTPSLAYADLSTRGDAFGAKGHSTAGYVSYVQSDLRAILATVDIAWAFPVSRRLDAELGMGLGIGIPFGDLNNTWVYGAPEGPIALGNGRYAGCKSVTDGVGCRPQDHASPTPVRIGQYVERGWSRGGSSPDVIPWVAIPQAALRIRLSESIAMRVGAGLATTGFWVGVGVTQALASAPHAP